MFIKKEITDFKKWLSCVKEYYYDSRELYLTVSEENDRGPYKCRRRGKSLVLEDYRIDYALLITSEKAKQTFLSMIESPAIGSGEGTVDDKEGWSDDDELPDHEDFEDDDDDNDETETTDSLDGWGDDDDDDDDYYSGSLLHVLQQTWTDLKSVPFKP